MSNKTAIIELIKKDLENNLGLSVNTISEISKSIEDIDEFKSITSVIESTFQGLDVKFVDSSRERNQNNNEKRNNNNQTIDAKGDSIRQKKRQKVFEAVMSRRKNNSISNKRIEGTPNRRSSTQGYSDKGPQGYSNKGPNRRRRDRNQKDRPVTHAPLRF